MSNHVIAVGTEKGAYLLSRTDGAWTTRGPLFAGWKVTAWAQTPSGRYLAGLGSNWFGASIHGSVDLENWEQVEASPSYPEGRSLTQIWTIVPRGDTVLTGVAEAGLFRSVDDGEHWDPVTAINDYPGHEQWLPGLGGLAAHHILSSGSHLWIGISAVGVFRSDDDALSFSRADEGVTPVAADEAGESGFCVHGLAVDPDRPELLWRQDHSGVYRSENAGDWWERIEEGLPASFGFPMVREPLSGRLFVVPLHSDANRVPTEGRFSAWCSNDDGESWTVAGTGWPEEPTYTSVLRNAAATDGQGGVFLGTTGGTIWHSGNAGDHWEPLPVTLPRILSLKVLNWPRA